MIQTSIVTMSQVHVVTMLVRIESRGIWTPSNNASLSPTESITQTAYRSVQPFLSQIHRIECPYTLQWDAPSPQNCPSHYEIGSIDPHLIHGSLGPSECSTQTGLFRSVQPFLQGSLVRQIDRQTNRPTDHATRSVSIGRIYVRSTVSMRPNDIDTVVSPWPSRLAI